jgi:hypothetical protein
MGNEAVLKWRVCKEIQKERYSEGDAILVLRDLINDGVLYELDYNSYRMVAGE